MRRRTLLSVLAGAVVVAVAGVLAAMLPTEVPVSVGGQVTCRTGRAVSGVWIEAANGGSDFAFLRLPTTGGPAEFTAILPFGGRYAVHVGCGGTGAHWNTENWSGSVPGGRHDFVCDDENATGVRRGVCG
jgi:hypothetical protein